jgi:drug/metabolite transporter (DMT)-like permease
MASGEFPTETTFLARITHAPAALLLIVGTLLGLNFPLGKLAGAAGVPPLVWSALIAVGGVLVLGAVLVARRIPVPLDLRHLRYFTVVAVLSYAVPNALIYTAIPHLGSAYAAILFTLSPMLTVVFSMTARLRRPRPMELAGIGIGFVGTVLVASARGEVGHAVEWLWIGIGVLVPLSLALGNVYRTIDLPHGTPSLVLAVGSNAVAALLLIVIAAATGTLGGGAALTNVPGIALLQIAASAAMFALFFQLQVVGGPVTLSQIGTVAAAVGVIAGTLGLGERYAPVVWIGIAVIALGIALTVRARLSP